MWSYKVVPNITWLSFSTRYNVVLSGVGFEPTHTTVISRWERQQPHELHELLQCNQKYYNRFFYLGKINISILITLVWNSKSLNFVPKRSIREKDRMSDPLLSYTYWLGMRVIALLLSPRYQLFFEATPRKIVGTEGTNKVLLPEYQVYKCFIILNNCAIQNSKLGPFLMDF